VRVRDEAIGGLREPSRHQQRRVQSRLRPVCPARDQSVGSVAAQRGGTTRNARRTRVERKRCSCQRLERGNYRCAKVRVESEQSQQQAADPSHNARPQLFADAAELRHYDFRCHCHCRCRRSPAVQRRSPLEVVTVADIHVFQLEDPPALGGAAHSAACALGAAAQQQSGMVGRIVLPSSAVTVTASITKVN
jgi:hypothetical protein